MATQWSDADFQVSANERLAAEVRLAVAERLAPPNHPALAAGYLGMVDGLGAQTIVQKIGDYGAGIASQQSETGAVTPDDITYTSYSATVVRHAKARQVSDFAAFLDPVSGVVTNPQKMAIDAVSIRNNTLMSLVAEAAATFSTYSVGSTGAALTWATIRAAKNKLSEGSVDFAEGDLCCLLHPAHWSDLEADLLANDGNPEARSAEGQDILVARASGYRGRYFGIDFFTSTRVPTANAGADYASSLFAPGAIAWADGGYQQDPHGFMDILDGGKLMIEYERDPSRSLKTMFYNFRAGVSRGDDLRGVKIIAGA